MNFEWDEAKRKSNLAKHGLDFADAHLAFNLPMFAVLDDRESYEEARFQAISLIHGNFTTLVYTESVEGTIRIISMRRATPQERKIYEREI